MVKSREINTNALGEILKQARIKAGYSREQIAERVGINIRYLTAIENEKRKPAFDVLYRLIRSIGVSADYIFYPEAARTELDRSQLMRLIQQCDERDSILVTALVNKMLDESTNLVPSE